jgi:hypothetical protein
MLIENTPCWLLNLKFQNQISFLSKNKSCHQIYKKENYRFLWLVFQFISWCCYFMIRGAYRWNF